MLVRMKDMARDLGVSVITVSKALRNHTDISAATRARVLKKAKELNYRPNLAARALVTGRSNMMGLVVPDIVRPFFAFLARGLAAALRNSGYTLVISSSEDDAEIEKQAIDQLVSRSVDVLLVASIQWSVETFRRVEEAGIPYILIDRSFMGLASNFVGVNDEQVGAIATEHLIDIGCKTIAHISRTRISSAIGRLEGYKKTMARHGFNLGAEYIFHTDRADQPAEVMGYQAAHALLALNPRPDGIFCYNDPAAIGAMKAIFDAGLRVPEDVALVGCGNIHYDDYLRVPLTSVDQQSAMIGQRAARLAVSLVGSTSTTKPRSIVLEPKLIMRESTNRNAH
ncbi:MAG: LacI family DNA-binding transcriptional regulator [Candidatus Acidiferrales bacterium]